MPYNKMKSEDTIQKTVRLPKSLNDKIEQLAIKSDRDFTKQVIYMLKEFIKIKEV